MVQKEGKSGFCPICSESTTDCREMKNVQMNADLKK